MMPKPYHECFFCWNDAEWVDEGKFYAGTYRNTFMEGYLQLCDQCKQDVETSTNNSLAALILRAQQAYDLLCQPMEKEYEVKFRPYREARKPVKYNGIEGGEIFELYMKHGRLRKQLKPIDKTECEKLGCHEYTQWHPDTKRRNTTIDDTTTTHIEEHLVDGNGYVIRHHSTHNGFREHIIVGEPTDAQWDEYANSDDDTLRLLAANHPGTTTTTLERLALTDPNGYVQAAAALNPSTPDEVRNTHSQTDDTPGCPAAVKRIARYAIKNGNENTIQLGVQSQQRRRHYPNN